MLKKMTPKWVDRSCDSEMSFSLTQMEEAISIRKSVFWLVVFSLVGLWTWSYPDRLAI
uniref:Uncharacterized protein n=1 Tax=Nelumbo nucifera TaxID=4432 RepID=A0A822Y3S9_NELNU|nr:TPA_asm: hypothetical protein HUJ06_027427 [Nelumbo nucifera]